MHRLLQRQLKKHFGPLDTLPDELKPFVEAVDEAYRQADADRALLEHSSELAWQELLSRNEQLREQQKRLEDVVRGYTESAWQAVARERGQLRGLRFRTTDIEAAPEPAAEAEAAWKEGGARVYTDESDKSAGLSVPIKLRDQIIGLVDLRFEREDVPPETVTLVEQLASRLALALENARLLQETERALADTRRRAEREQTLAAIADRLHAATDVTAVLRIAAEEMRRATRSARAVVRLKSEAPHA